MGIQLVCGCNATPFFMSLKNTIIRMLPTFTRRHCPPKRPRLLLARMPEIRMIVCLTAPSPPRMHFTHQVYPDFHLFAQQDNPHQEFDKLATGYVSRELHPFLSWPDSHATEPRQKAPKLQSSSVCLAAAPSESDDHATSYSRVRGV
jgi:hypothetical protein